MGNLCAATTSHVSEGQLSPKQVPSRNALVCFTLNLLSPVGGDADWSCSPLQAAQWCGCCFLQPRWVFAARNPSPQPVFGPAALPPLQLHPQELGSSCALCQQPIFTVPIIPIHCPHEA